MREKLIELRREAEEIAENFCVSRMECYQCPYDPTKWCQEGIIADHLIANGVTIRKWIPVTERLPDSQHDWVLVACKFVPEGYYGVPHIAELRNGEWWADCGDFSLIDCGVEVTHWMPLPEPPKP